jgi:putative flippase GtrA
MPSTLPDLITLLRRPTAAQFVRFAVVGACNTALDFSVYVLLTRLVPFWGRHLLLAATVSFSLAAVSSFIFNNFWTFRHSAEGWLERLPKFSFIVFGGLCWNLLLLHLLLSAGMNDIIAKLAATCIVLFWNFTLQKLWAFKR